VTTLWRESMTVMTLVAATAATLPAQALRRGPFAEPAWSAVQRAPIKLFDLKQAVSASTHPHSIAPTYWLEGGVIGALVVGLWAGTGSRDFCEWSAGCQVLVGVLSGAVGFVPGALVGGLFPKRDGALSPPPD
jgi:hypothetical protein